ncbi:probable G-protein coupled receptor 139 [Chiloscyllium punctatum]|uniref:probable G-protein coupled receptor 139 n=1 Tax=Chiloscyllium punctatum TaxID=137246 RepID=UPI003B63813C
MVYYPIIAIVGIPANVITIVILSQGKCGLSRCISHYLITMASSDLLVLIADVVFVRISDCYFPTTFLFNTPVCSFIYMLARTATDLSVWLTIAFTFDRFIGTSCQKLRLRYCTKKTAAVVTGTVCLLFCSKNIPFCFAFAPNFTVNNIGMGCNFKLEFYTEAAWVAYTWIDRTLTPLLPTFLILLLNVLTVGYILTVSRIRKRLRGSKYDVDQNDPELEKRRKSMILLFAVSGNFLLLWITYIIVFVLYQATNYYYANSWNDPMLIADVTSFMLLHLGTCTNTFIYAVIQTKFREELKIWIKHPLEIKLWKRCVHGRIEWEIGIPFRQHDQIWLEAGWWRRRGKGGVLTLSK